MIFGLLTIAILQICCPKYIPLILLPKETGITISLSSIDVKINIVFDKVQTSVYHKVDDFPFPVVLLTFPGSLIS